MAPVVAGGDGAEIDLANEGRVQGGPFQARHQVVEAAIEMGAMRLCWQQLGIAETVGQEGIAAAVHRLQDGDAEEFVIGGGEHQVGLPQQPGIGIPAFGVAPVDDV